MCKVKHGVFTVHELYCSIVKNKTMFPRVQLCGVALLTLCGGGPEAGRQTQHQTPKQGQAAPFHSRPHSWMSKSSQIL